MCGRSTGVGQNLKAFLLGRANVALVKKLIEFFGEAFVWIDAENSDARSNTTRIPIAANTLRSCSSAV